MTVANTIKHDELTAAQLFFFGFCMAFTNSNPTLDTDHHTGAASAWVRL
jgi:hypothetical protein